MIVIISELAKKNSLLAGILASIPFVSVLSIIWLYIETKNIENINNLSNSIFFMVFPSLVFFISLPVFLKLGINFYLGLCSSIFLTFCFYGLTIFILSRYGIKI